MNNYLLIPAVSTLAGCLTGYFLRALIIKRLPLLLRKLSGTLSADLFTAADLQAIIAGKSDFQNIRPLIEEHIDEFLQHKLGKEMPMIGMFIGDKTIAQLKSIFMKELEEIFPLVMDKYISDLAAGFNPQELLSRKISSFYNRNMQSLLYYYTGIELKVLIWGGAVLGLLTGILQLVAIRLIA